jgi:nucleoside-diphosphate-sugar epimerase
MRVFVTGGSGFIGAAVVAELARAGHRVVGLARSEQSARQLAGSGVEVVRASLSDVAALRSAAADSDGVIHLAYGHGEPADDAAAADRRAITALGDALVGTDRPLVVTSGTLVLPAGRAGIETDPPDPRAPAAGRGEAERAALTFAARGVRSAVVRLAPSVHERVRRGFVGTLIDAAVRTGFSGYVGDGAQRWPTLHRQDAALLYRLALEHAPAGSVLHGVGETGVRLKAIAATIGAGLHLPVTAVPPERATAHFGWLGTLVGTDAPASSVATRELLGWHPAHPGLLDDLEHGDFFATRAVAGRP